MIKKAIFLYFSLIVICTSCDLLGNDCPGKDYKHLPYYAVNGFMLTPHEGLYFSQTVTDTLKPLSIDSFNIKLNSLLTYYAKNRGNGQKSWSNPCNELNFIALH